MDENENLRPSKIEEITSEPIATKSNPPDFIKFSKSEDASEGQKLKITTFNTFKIIVSFLR